MISADTAAAEHLKIGSALATTTTTGVAIRLRVVGVYRPVAPGGSFWGPWDLFQFGQPGSPTQNAPGDASFVTSAALSSRVQRVLETLSANVALLPQPVGSDDIGELRTTIAHVNATDARLTNRAGTSTSAATLTTSLPTILDAAAKETSLARTLVTVATAQLAVLAMFLLYAVVANMTTAQGPEVALAKLRGRRAGSVLLQSVAQPVALVLVAGPVAALLAWVLVRLLAARLLGHPVDVVFPPAAYGVAALGVLGGVLAAVVAARRIVVTPVGALMRVGASASGSPIGLLVADAAAVTARWPGWSSSKLVVSLTLVDRTRSRCWPRRCWLSPRRSWYCGRCRCSPVSWRGGRATRVNSRRSWSSANCCAARLRPAGCCWSR